MARTKQTDASGKVVEKMETRGSPAAKAASQEEMTDEEEAWEDQMQSKGTALLDTGTKPAASKTTPSEQTELVETR
jgi:hypothetical protein